MSQILKRWLKANKRPRKVFADEIGVSDSTLHRLMKGSHPTTTETLRLISEGTNGECGEKELYEDWLAARNAFLAPKSSDDSIIVVSCAEQVQ